MKERCFYMTEGLLEIEGECCFYRMCPEGIVKEDVFFFLLGTERITE